MNELIPIKKMFNVVSICILKNGKNQSKLYDWFLPYSLLNLIHLNDTVKIKVDEKVMKVRIINLSYHLMAEYLHKPFPYFESQPSWQIRLIGQLLNERGYTYHRERCFKGLVNIDGRPLRVDISFQKNDRWYFIEYHGTHHYFRRGATLKRFNNIRRVMEIKREWCRQNNVKYLEIPFYRQNDIKKIIKKILEL
ncbi:hypothetical protein A5819_003629 [Enterococcus sp. 7E2_DIV0204]|uniref:hypothetical protein n=1 Tax=unclassified Enterococcus TaxID=2608891 RepID=UPI000A332314|nr:MULTISPECIES: hypothetical protein [unclassified Enterococcus]OTN83810.1 hypothetical protein A5819_003629 [Enterococcus sp. 7E2_DIV0204]OTP47538.1 hypothetical protein A5884_003509 [Enterococcus sp. 7D2_DIV0200]